MQTLYVEVKSVYGNILYYPMEPVEMAEAIKTLTGKETISLKDVSQLNKLGIKVEAKLYQEIGGLK